MISLDLVNESIIELEQKDTSFANCERLAWLYIVKDNLQRYNNTTTPNKIAVTGDSAFIKAINGKNPEQLWKIIDELMEVVQATQPRVYNKVLQTIQEL